MKEETVRRKRKMSRKKWCRAVCFVCLAAILLYMADCVLCVKSPHGVDQVRALYVQPSDRVDVLFLGSSHVHCNVNTKLLWDEYGIAAYLCTSAEQPLWNSYYDLVDALKTQKPKLVVLDMYSPAHVYEDFQPKWVEENLDGMRPSLNKWRAVEASTQENRAEYLFGFLRYHTRYDRLNAEDFENFFWNRKQRQKWKGYTLLQNHAELIEQDLSHVTQSMPMTEKSQLYFDKILALTQKEGIALALVSAPYLPEESDQMVYHDIERLAQENNILFLNYNTTAMYREAGIDFSLDFADHTHLNEEGGKKYTRHLGGWLKNHYEIPDRRGQKGYTSWEEQEIRIVSQEE